MREVEGVETKMLYKFDQKIFTSTRGANHHLNLLMMWHSWPPPGKLLKEAIRTYQQTAKAFGLTLSTTNTKFIMVDHGVTEEEKLPITVEGGMVGHVEHFQYLAEIVRHNWDI